MRRRPTKAELAAENAALRAKLSALQAERDLAQVHVNFDMLMDVVPTFAAAKLKAELLAKCAKRTTSVVHTENGWKAEIYEPRN